MLTSTFFDLQTDLLFKSNTSTSHNSLILQVVIRLLIIVGGEGWIRTIEGLRRQIYSLVHLAAMVPHHKSFKKHKLSGFVDTSFLLIFCCIKS
jgi:hypothetical protein